MTALGNPHRDSEIHQAMRHAEAVLPDVAAACVVNTLLSLQHCVNDPAVRRYIARVLALPDPDMEVSVSTLDSRTRAEIGRSSNNRGKEAEQRVARYLAANGWPAAKRTVRTGWRVGDKVARDCGDIDGIGSLCCQVKVRSTELSDNGIKDVLAQAADQAVAAGADLGFVVERRAGKSDPEHWWSWLYVGDLYVLIESERDPNVLVVTMPQMNLPTRLRLGDLVTLLHRAGYGVGK